MAEVDGSSLEVTGVEKVRGIYPRRWRVECVNEGISDVRGQPNCRRHRSIAGPERSPLTAYSRQRPWTCNLKNKIKLPTKSLGPIVILQLKSHFLQIDYSTIRRSKSN